MKFKQTVEYHAITKTRMVIIAGKWSFVLPKIQRISLWFIDFNPVDFMKSRWISVKSLFATE